MPDIDNQMTTEIAAVSAAAALPGEDPLADDAKPTVTADTADGTADSAGVDTDISARPGIDQPIGKPARVRKSKNVVNPVGVSFEIDEPWSLDAIWDVVATGQSFLLFGDELTSHVALAPIATAPGDWEREPARIVCTRTIRVDGFVLDNQVLRLANFGLAGDPDGPVIALCEISGAPTMAPGSSFEFTRGHIVFR